MKRYTVYITIKTKVDAEEFEDVKDKVCLKHNINPDDLSDFDIDDIEELSRSEMWNGERI